VGELVDRVLHAQVIPDSIRVIREFQQHPVLELDADLMQSALSNLVRNAVEAMAGAGDLTLRIQRDGADVAIAVSDSGPGIGPSFRAHLFEPLHSTKPSGVGLGLLTARTFVEAHGGRLSFVETAKGACFEIHLPALDHPTSALGSTPAGDYVFPRDGGPTENRHR
jgi:signal transduction histidine kinase